MNTEYPVLKGTGFFDRRLGQTWRFSLIGFYRSLLFPFFTNLMALAFK